MKNTFVLYFVLFFILFSCNQKRRGNKTSDRFEPGVPYLVGSTDFNTSFSYYNTTPESPDGKKIAYTKFLDSPKEDRDEKVPAEIWVCNTDLKNHHKIVSISNIQVHNGARVQWLDNNSLAYQDDSIRAVNLDGDVLMQPVEGRIGHETFKGKILFSAKAKKSGLSTIFEHDVFKQKTQKLADIRDFSDVLTLYPDSNLRSIPEMNILHLQYSPSGKKIAFRMDIGPKNERYKQLVIMNVDGSDIRYFGPKPMHFSWFDINSIEGHDNQIKDGMVNDKSGRVWDFQRNVLETLSGPGNHFAASTDKKFIASETWYNSLPVVLNTYKRGNMEPFWSDTISTDYKTTWKIAYHANPAFSRDGNRLYYNKCVATGKVFAYMVVLPKN